VVFCVQVVCSQLQQQLEAPAHSLAAAPQGQQVWVATTPLLLLRLLLPR
jgi:hypothetical protein